MGKVSKRGWRGEYSEGNGTWSGRNAAAEGEYEGGGTEKGV